MTDFARSTSYTPDTAFSHVKYGYKSPITEVDLEELQLIQSQYTRQLVRTIYGDGFLGTGVLSGSGGSVTLSNDLAVCDGRFITVSGLTIQLNDGETAYLDVYEQEITKDSTIHQYGNQQGGAVVTNYLNDIRYQVEVTRRIQVVYTIVKVTGVAGHTYLPIALYSGGKIVDKRVPVSLKPLSDKIPTTWDQLRGV